MHILVTTLGSHGDLHPFLGIAAALKSRGHDVKVIASAYYDPLVRAMGFDFVPLGTPEEFLEMARDPDIWHPRRGFALIGQSISRSIQPCYQAILDHAIAGQTVLVYSTLASGARIAQETLRLPGVSVHLSPAVFRSVHQSPRLAGMPMPPWLPKWARRWMFNLADLLVVDRIFGKPINVFRAQLGLPKVHGVLQDWCHSPQRTIGLFPDWFAPIQPDWPRQTVLTGFPLFDESGLSDPTVQVKEFLDSGLPPIVFTPGSANLHGHKFFAAGAEACRLLGRRGVLLTRHGEQIPRALPAGVIHVPYIPFSGILPRSAALVHHGGIGSTAQAMSAGVPQLIMPMGFDQPDNADRIKRLGIGDALEPSKFTGAALAEKLKNLIESASVGEACKKIAAHFKTDTDPLAKTVQSIEAVRELAP